MNTNFKVALAFIGGVVVGSYVMYNKVYEYMSKTVLNAMSKGADEKVQDTHEE